MSDPAPPRTKRPWWITALVYGGGVVTGALVVALLGLGTPDFQSYRDAGGNVPPPATSPLPLQGSAEVNAACLRVINSAQDVQVVVGNVEQAGADVDLQVLDDLVRQLQPIEDRLRRDLQDCRVTAAAGPATPGPTPDPTAGSTPEATPFATGAPTAAPTSTPGVTPGAEASPTPIVPGASPTG